MKWIKYIFRYLIYRLVHLSVSAVCLLGKVGIAKDYCNQLRASVVLGEGAGAYLHGNYELSYKVLSPYLNVEDDLMFGGIKYQLALHFFYGKGVTLNRQVANRLFEESAALGWEDAITYLSQYEKPQQKET